MEIRKNDFPVTLQAFEVRDSREEFIAEQIVNSQPEADQFTSRFTGKLIKAHALRPDEVRRIDHPAKPHRSTIPAWAIVLFLLVVLTVVAWFSGWLQPVVDRLS